MTAIPSQTNADEMPRLPRRKLAPRTWVGKWTIASVVATVALWTIDASLRVLIFHDGTFVQQLVRPTPETLLARMPLLAFGIVLLLSLRGIRLLENARAEAVAERRRLREAYDYMTDAVMLLDRDMRVVFMNKAAERIGGKRLTEAVGSPCHRAIIGAEEPCPTCAACEVLETGQPRTTTKYETTESGQENWLEQRWYPVTDEAGEVVAVLEVAKDITDRKLLEREVAALHKLIDAKRREA